MKSPPSQVRSPAQDHSDTDTDRTGHKHPVDCELPNNPSSSGGTAGSYIRLSSGHDAGRECGGADRLRRKRPARNMTGRQEGHHRQNHAKCEARQRSRTPYSSRPPQPNRVGRELTREACRFRRREHSKASASSCRHNFRPHLSTPLLVFTRLRSFVQSRHFRRRRSAR